MTVETALGATLAAIQEVAGYLWQRGWAERNAGNLSVDVTAEMAAVDAPSALAARVPYPVPDPALGGRWLLVSATGSRFRDLARSPASGLLLVRVAESLDGYDLAWGSAGARPTSELISHLSIHAALAAAGAPHRVVLHTHPTHLIALSHCPPGADQDTVNQALWSMMPEVKVFVPEGVGLAAYRRPGSADLADVTVAALADHRVVLWALHGCLAVERDIGEAFDLIDTLDKAAHMYLICRAAGYEPVGLSAEAVTELGRMARVLGIPP
jgi:rhamnulose-1-phosphate aldolase